MHRRVALILAVAAWGLPALPAQASVVEPCARVLALYGARGEKGWVRQCAADMARAGRRPDARACHAQLIRCLRRPITPTL